jgi:signal transduction histidine kinase
MWYLTAAAVALVLLIGALGYRVSTELRLLVEEPKDSLQWAAFQFQNEYNRFYQTVLEYDPTDPSSVATVRLRYDILFSRIGLLEAAPSFAKARQDPTLGGGFMAIAVPLKDLASAIDGDVQAALDDGRIRDELQAMMPAMQKVMAEIVQFVGRESDATRRSFKEALNYLLLALLLFLAFLMLGVGALLLQRRRLNQSETKLRQSEQDLAMAQDIAGVGSMRWDIETGKLSATPVLKKIFGLREDQEPTRELLLGLIHPYDRGRIVEKYRADVLERMPAGTVRTSEVEYRVLRADNSVRHVRDSARLFFGQDGRARTISAAVLDLTEESTRRQALADSERHLLMAQELAKVGSFSWDLASGRIACSRQFRQIYDIGDAEMTGTRLLRRFHRADWVTVKEEIRRLLRKGTEGSVTAPIQYRIRVASGAVRTVRSVLQLARGENDASLRVIGTTQDVTAEEEQALALQEARVAAERATLREELEMVQRREIIGLLAAGLAHDFNNLLATISGSAALIETELEPQGPGAAGVARIQAASEQAVGLVKRLLSLGARRTSGIRTDLRVSLREAAELVRSGITPPARLVVDLPDQPIETVADPTDILQLVLNLALNARDALAGKAGEISIRLAPASAKDLQGTFAVGAPNPARRYACIEIADTGPGMPPDVKDQIFRPYFSTKGDKGTGLGLAIVGSVAAGNGCAVKLETEPGRGTRFSILWPSEDAEQRPEPRGPEGLTGSLRGKSVLVVDDQEDVLRVLTAFLESAGAEVAPSPHPADAIDALREDPEAWHLLVTDYDMPGVNGTELAREARAIRPGLPILLVTALPGFAGRAGTEFDVVLGKPVQREALVAAAESAILRSTR